MSYSELDIRYGRIFTYGVGAFYRPRKSVLLSLDASGIHRTRSEERVVGDIVNSGGDWFYGDLGVTYLYNDRLAVGLTARLPLYSNVNGEQISQSWGVNSFISITFGKESDEHDHDHGDEHDHGHEGEHEGHEGEHEHEGHEGHEGEHEGHEGEHEHEGHEGEHEGHEGEHGHESAGEHRSGDIAVLAAGGRSFDLAAAAVPGKFVVIDFWAEWCAPCIEIKAILTDYAAKYSQLAVRKVEVPSFDEPVAKQHLKGVSGLPVIWIMDANGQIIRKLESVPIDKLRKELDAILGPPPSN